jgi:hypothetical protein
MKSLIIIGFIILVGNIAFGQKAQNYLQKDSRLVHERIIIASQENLRKPEIFQKTQNFVNFRSSDNSNDFVSEFEKIIVPENANNKKMKGIKKFKLNDEFSHRQFSAFNFGSKNYNLLMVKQNLVANNNPFKQKLLKLIGSSEVK